MHFVRELVRNKCAVKLEYCASLARVLASDQSGPGNRRMSVRRLLRPGLRGRAACGSDPLGGGSAAPAVTDVGARESE